MSLLFLKQKQKEKKFKIKLIDPPKSAFLSETKTFKKCFFIFFFCFSFKNYRCTNVVLVNIFENALKQVNNSQKQPKWHFWRLIGFFGAFSKILINKTFVRPLFKFKAESKPKHGETNCLWGFSSKTKNNLFWGSK